MTGPGDEATWRRGDVATRRRVGVKICGLTRPEDAALAVRLGASYLGVIFAGGPRQVDIPAARAIVAVAGQVPVLGVFGSQPDSEILPTCRAAGLAGAQLHQGATAQLFSTLGAAGLLALPVVHLSEPSDLSQLDQWRASGGPVLIEPRVPGRLGGTGVALPFALAIAAREQLGGQTLFLAGGLRPETVADAVRRIRPDVVDVSSGVEQIPGIKDPERMAHFFEALP